MVASLNSRLESNKEEEKTKTHISRVTKTNLSRVTKTHLGRVTKTHLEVA